MSLIKLNDLLWFSTATDDFSKLTELASFVTFAMSKICSLLALSALPVLAIKVQKMETERRSVGFLKFVSNFEQNQKFERLLG